MMTGRDKNGWSPANLRLELKFLEEDVFLTPGTLKSCCAIPGPDKNGLCEVNLCFELDFLEKDVFFTPSVLESFCMITGHAKNGWFRLIFVWNLQLTSLRRVLSGESFHVGSSCSFHVVFFYCQRLVG